MESFLEELPSLLAVQRETLEADHHLMERVGNWAFQLAVERVYRPLA